MPRPARLSIRPANAVDNPASTRSVNVSNKDATPDCRLLNSAFAGLKQAHGRSRNCIHTSVANDQTHHADAKGNWNGTWLNDLYFGQRGGLYVGDEREQRIFLSELRKIGRHIVPETGFVPYNVSADGTKAAFNVQGMDFDRRCEFVLMVVRAYEVTGDAAFARELLPLCRIVLDRLRQQDLDGDLLLEGRELGGSVKNLGSCASISYIGDTVKNDWKDFGASLFLYDAMRRLAKLEECLGQKGSARKRQEQAEAIGTVLRKVFWNPSSGGYLAWIERNGKRHADWITGNNCHAIACGLAAPGQAKAILDYLEQNRAELIEVVPGRVRTGLYDQEFCAQEPNYYWNGGVWTLITGPMMIALAQGNRWPTLVTVMDRLSNQTAVDEYGFNEAYDGSTGKPTHVSGLLMNNGGFLWGVFEGIYGLAFDGDEIVLRASAPAAALPATARISYRGQDLQIRWPAAGKPKLAIDGVTRTPRRDKTFRLKLPAAQVLVRRIEVGCVTEGGH